MQKVLILTTSGDWFKTLAKGEFEKEDFFDWWEHSPPDAFIQLSDTEKYIQKRNIVQIIFED